VRLVRSIDLIVDITAARVLTARLTAADAAAAP